MKLPKSLEAKLRAKRAERLLLGLPPIRRLPTHWKPEQLESKRLLLQFWGSLLLGLSITAVGIFLSYFWNLEGNLLYITLAGTVGGFSASCVIFASKRFEKWRANKQGQLFEPAKSSSSYSHVRPQLERDGQLAGWELLSYQKTLTPEEAGSCAVVPGDIIRQLYGIMKWEPTTENLEWAKTVLHDAVAAMPPVKALERLTEPTFLEHLYPFSDFVDSEYVRYGESDPTVKSLALFSSYMDTKSLRLLPDVDHHYDSGTLNRVLSLPLVGERVLISKHRFFVDSCEMMRPELETLLLQILRDAEIELRENQAVAASSQTGRSALTSSATV